MREVPRARAPAKAVVFASYNEGLEHVLRTLKRAGIGAVRIKGKAAAKAIETFVTDGACRVCLLHTSQDAAGLTLTAASHVIIVEPQPDVAVEQQMVGRVHRIGQTRQTHVHRLVVSGTFEPALATERLGGGDGGAL